MSNQKKTCKCIPVKITIASLPSSFSGSHQYSSTLADGDVGSGQVDGHRANIRSFWLAAFFVLGHNGEGCHHRGIAYRHQRVSAGTHVGVHDAIKSVVVRITSNVANAHSCKEGQLACVRQRD